MSGPTEPPHVSLLTRMLVFFGVAGTLLNLSIWGLVYVARDQVQGTLPRSIPSAFSEHPTPTDGPLLPEMVFRLRHAQNLMNEIAKNPTQEEFLRHLNGEKIQARFESPQLEWSTDDSLPDADHVIATGEALWPYTGFRVTPELVARQDGNVRWVVRFPANWGRGFLQDPRIVLGLFINVTTMLLLCVLFYFSQLRPLQALRKGVAQFSDGNLAHRIPVNQNSKLGDLAQAFNQMSEKLQKLVRAKDEIVSAVSHEIRSPLTRMRLAIEVEGEKSLPRIQRNVDQIERLIKDILESKSLESQNTELATQPVHLKDVMANVRASFTERATCIEVSIPNGLPAVEGDRQKLTRVFENLVENSLKYSTSDSRVWIDADAVDNGIKIRIRDRGPGVPPEALEKIFEPFFRVDPSRSPNTGGFGFGLHLCRRIIEAHGGTIRAENAPDGGLVISLFLPRQTCTQSPKPFL